ncbi:MAG: TonB-dependent receptor [bacterium]|nr:TonB-dependent receptor [bacterium]
MFRTNCTNPVSESGFISRMLTTLVLLMVMVAVGFAQEPAQTFKEGKISGRMIDAETGEALIGVTVMLEGTKLGAVTDLDGNFTIKRVPVGTYTLVASSVGYTATKVTAVEVTEGEIERVDLALKPQVVQTEGIEVIARVEKNNEASLLKLRQKSNSVSDAISAEQITRSGSSDAAAAMTRVTGASVVGGKYVYVRGLGDRYANTRINGALAPSPDPDKQAVPMDMIPTAMLDNIVVEKTFTPDKPGNFSGGSVDMTTKDMPEGRLLSFNTSATYNTQTTFEENALATRSSGDDWMAMGADDRDIADWLKQPLTPKDLTYGDIIRDTANAQYIFKQSKAVNSQMTPVRRTAPLNQSYGLSYGDSWSFFDMPMGFISSFSYSRNRSYYSNGQSSLRNWSYDYNELKPNDTLDITTDYIDEQGKEEVLWGGLFNSTIRPHPNHKVGFAMIYNRNAESTARIVQGFDYNVASGQYYRSQSMTYSERTLGTMQFKGEHAKLPLDSRFEWMLSLTRSSQEDPDMRFFSDVIDTVEGGGSIWLTYPAHYYRNLLEKNREGRVDYSLPFKQWSGLSSKVKVGGFYLHKTREFREREFKLANVGSIQYTGDPDAFLDDSNFGPRPDSTPDNFIDYGLLWAATSGKKANFNADQDITAVYGMMELPITSKLTVVGGVRFETTEMNLDQIYVSTDTTDVLDGEDLLPSVNLIYKLTDNMNARLAYGRTLARPTMREVSPHSTWEFVGGGYFIGNPKLKYTKIDNYDARWEWFLRPGEIVAVSGFIKRFYDPIERAYLNFNGDVTAINVNRADVYGLEFEWRRRLNHVDALPFLQNFQIGGNLTFVKSEVRLPEEEFRQEKNWDPANASETREFQGQSPFVLNLDLGYDNEKTGTNVNLMYNRFGKRLSEVTLGVTPSVYEQARTTVDVTLSQKLWGGVTLKGSAKNLTDSEHLKTYELYGRDYVAQSYKTGVTYGIGMSYSL